MENAFAGAGPMLPLWALLPLTALVLAMLVVGMRSVRSIAGRYVIFALALRYVLDAYHAYTFQQVGGGLSGNALASVLLVGLGLLVIRREHLLLRRLVPIYLLMATIAISGILAGDIAGTLEVLAKYGLLLVVAIATVEALRVDGDRLAPALLWAFATPMLFQPASIVLGVVKASENDGSASYIGGFSHEGAFSMVAMTAFVVAVFARRAPATVRAVMMIGAVCAIVIANYRTTIIAMIPILVFQLVHTGLGSFKRGQRGLAATFAALAVVAAPVILGVDLGPRFADIGAVVSRPGDIIRPVSEFTVDDSRFLSGRSLIWSRYYEGYRDGTPLQHLVGRGPDSWVPYFRVYAHNTLVSHLYEFGMLGAAATLLVWLYYLVLAFRAEPRSRAMLVSAHLGFLVLNMSTMPMWSIEGILLYALIVGYTIGAARRRPERTVRRTSRLAAVQV